MIEETKNEMEIENLPSDIRIQEALKTLQYGFDTQFRVPISALMKESDRLSPAQKLLVTHLHESLERTQSLLGAALREGSSKSEGATQQRVTDRVQVEKVLRALAITSSLQDSSDFFEYCVKTLAEFYGVQYAFVGCINPDGEHVRTLAVWAGDSFGENFEYSLSGTPCADIINYSKELIPTGAADLYPDDEMLGQMMVDSYFGAPLVTKDDGVVGIVSVMGVSPMVVNEWVAPVLGLFATRLALELQREETMEDLHRLNTELETRVEERTHQLKIANDELEAFSYSVSHDLRGPVRAINSFLDILQEEFGHEFSADARGYLELIQNTGLKMNGLIDDLLLLSKVLKVDLAECKLDITQMSADYLRELQEQSPLRKVRVVVQPDISAWGDPGLLQIALQNLLDNAWTYTENEVDPLIEVGKVQVENDTVFYVRDNGVGFDMAYVEKVFEPFQRLHRDVDFSGSGVGMATTRRIVHRHGGSIWASAEPGNGATFRFKLGGPSAIKAKV
jgi:signal transduction histidine kinase